MAMESKRRNNKGRGRGVLALTSYEPCPRPSASTIGMWHRPSQGVGKNVEKRIPSTNGETSLGGNSTKTNNNPKIIQNGCHEKDIRNNDHSQVNGYTENHNIKTNHMNNGQNVIRQNTVMNGNIKNITDDKEKTVVPNPPTQPQFSAGDLLAKYNYKAKPGRPGGFDEVTITQGEKLLLICKGHAGTKNPLWWEVRNEKGEQGFVPGTYCMVVEQKPTTLPWLENKRLLEEKEQKKRDAEMKAKGDAGFGAPVGPPKVKVYQSAYTNNGPSAKNAAEASKEYYCEICDKNLNGPQPYKSHMSSKAHREEVEYQQSK